MSFKYKWKNGVPPNRESALQTDGLLDEGQFNSDRDRELAEEEARKRLGLPIQPLDADLSVLPQATPTSEEEEF